MLTKTHPNDKLKSRGEKDAKEQKKTGRKRNTSHKKNTVDGSLCSTVNNLQTRRTVPCVFVSKITKKKFSAKQTRYYFQITHHLKSAFGIGKYGSTGRRVWFREAGLMSVFYNFTKWAFGM